MSTLVEDRIVLRLADKGDYGIVGIPTRAVPEGMPDGRALTPDPVVEGQVAVLSTDLSGAGQNHAVRLIAERHRERDASTPAHLRPFGLRELPAEVSLTDPEWSELASAMTGSRAGGWTPMGLGGDDLSVLGLDLSATPVALVAGPPKSGRTNLLRFVARAARAADLPVLGICPVANALMSDLEPDGAGLLTEGITAEDLVERLRTCGPGTVVLVDDAELLKEGPLATALLALVQQARGKQWRVVVAGSTADVASGYGGWLYELRKARQGLLLSPQAASDGDVYNLRLMRSVLLPRTQPGRGLLIDAAGGQDMVQVPLV
jgi:S-DNA-T family DNA segregation ATPase FtsK/SpoIIIE